MQAHGKGESPHSAEYFGEERDYWWNQDFLQLMAKRWQLDKVKKVLDVGCGVGHWGKLLSHFLPEDAKITGIDREEEWVSSSKDRTKGRESRFEYALGTAEEIPFEDNTFDMVTCQTVLLHVKDPEHAIQEMIRVLKPGGLIAVAEPNNLASEVVLDTLSADYPVEDIVKAVRFHMICERGTEKLGIGSGSIGDLIPHYYNTLGLKDIQVYLSDKVSMLYAPYASREQKVHIEQLQDWLNSEILIWNKADTKKYFLAGGGSEHEFEPMWQFLKSCAQSQLDAIAANSFTRTGGCLFYLISGRK